MFHDRSKWCHVCFQCCQCPLHSSHHCTCYRQRPNNKHVDLFIHNVNQSHPTKMALHYLFIMSFALSASGLTTDEVSQMKLMLKRNVVRGLSIPTALRLAFHDCVGSIFRIKIWWQNLFRWMRWLSEPRQPRQWGIGWFDWESGDPLPRAGLRWYHFKVC